ncbi:MAG: L-glyceraldehyde 3-phosphate reductase [Marinifilum sp.]|jgi:L-glyceraldehyde 3-phosphate reductase|nr:L-glyceraldehyde 3-phosphate reductase [Marinifilum sp.]
MHKASEDRYENMPYRRCGRSGLLLPAISLGLWHNFGHVDLYDNCKQILLRAFDRGVTHFDLANNYGPPPGSAEENFGKILRENLSHYRDEMIISTKAGYHMWPGPYGDWGSRKYLIASLDQSLKRMGLDYVDIFYSHRPDPNTPLEETMMALDHVVRQGRALYVGISSYTADQTREAARILRELGTPCLIHQPRYSMFDRWVEDGLLEQIEKDGIGSIVFSPLAQGLLTNKYIKGIPENSRAAKSHGFLQKDQITDNTIDKVIALNKIAAKRGQSLAQMAIAWLLKDERITSVLIGASSVTQLDQNIDSLNHLNFEIFELEEIEEILTT